MKNLFSAQNGRKHQGMKKYFVKQCLELTDYQVYWLLSYYQDCCYWSTAKPGYDSNYEEFSFIKNNFLVLKNSIEACNFLILSYITFQPRPWNRLPHPLMFIKKNMCKKRCLTILMCCSSMKLKMSMISISAEPVTLKIRYFKYKKIFRCRY